MGTFDHLDLRPVSEAMELLAEPVRVAIEASSFIDEAFVFPIDPELSDTAVFVEAYNLSLDISANCVIVSGKREGIETIAACMVLATTWADVNKTVRNHLNLRKVSFHSMDRATGETEMEYGGITPVGLPGDWPILIDQRVNDAERVIIGSGIRGSKLVLPGYALAKLPNAVVIEGLAN